MATACNLSPLPKTWPESACTAWSDRAVPGRSYMSKLAMREAGRGVFFARPTGNRSTCEPLATCWAARGRRRGPVRSRRKASEVHLDAGTGVELVGIGAAAGVLPAVADRAVECALFVDVVGQPSRDLGRDPAVIEGIAVADVEHIPRPVRGQLQVAGEVERVVGGGRVRLGDARVAKHAADAGRG